MMTLAKRKYAMDDSILMQIMVEAYPVVVFTKQLEDRSRKIMEIIEGADYRDGELVYRSLYKYHVEDNVTDEDGKTHVVGSHYKIEDMSDALQKRLLDNGIPHKELQEFFHVGSASRKASGKKSAGKKSRTAPSKGTAQNAIAADTEIKPDRTNSAEAELETYISEKCIPEKTVVAEAGPITSEIPTDETIKTQPPVTKNHRKETD